MMTPEFETVEKDFEEAEQAYIQAKTGRELFGELVRPWTPSRAVAAQTMGMIFPMIGEEGQASFSSRNSYPGMLQDVIIVCWLCTLPDEAPSNSQWTPSKALRSPIKALEAAMYWAEAEKMISQTGDAFRQGVELFLSIVVGEASSNFKVDVEGSSEQMEGDSGKV